MNIFQLQERKNGDIYVDNSSPMYPQIFEDKINKLAGENITYAGPELGGFFGGFFGGFINSFSIKKDKLQLFKVKVLPFIGSRNTRDFGIQIWDKDAESEGNNI